MNRWPRSTTRPAAIVLAMLASLVGCSDGPAGEAPYVKPFTLDTIAGSDTKQLTLTDEAIARLGIETAEVTEATDGLVVPYAAVIYLPDGSTWVYTNPDGNVFVRQPLTVKEIRGDEAVLDSGPEPGTAVAIVGVAELFGAEYKVGK